MTDEEWETLRAVYKERVLAMPCCGAACVPKVSHLGTRFFAHKSQRVCSSAPESEAHLRAKWVIATAAIGIGWRAESEAPGETPNGERWVADVLCTKGNAKVAFEVQLASQTHSEFLARQARYTKSEVRGCWLTKIQIPSEDRELPAFCLDISDLNALVVHSEAFRLPLTEFVTGALTGKLKWLDGSPGPYPAILELMPDNCWKCYKPVQLVTGIGFKGFGQTMALIQAVNEELVDAQSLVSVVDELRAKYPIVASLAWRMKTRDKIPFLASICPHCNSAFAEWYPFNAVPRARQLNYVRTKPVIVKSKLGHTVGWAWLGTRDGTPPIDRESNNESK